MNAEIHSDMEMSAETAPAARRPRIAIMGEFSAGKSTLTNLLMGAPALPVKVTATQLPPVWISRGEGATYRIGIDDSESPIDMDALAGITVADTQFIRVFHQSDVLDLCDLIDMPGISDPNMSSEVWERVAHFADGVIWCTHATQAWRQSEAAVWESFPEELFDKSLLLLTRFDKILNQRDRDRVVKRVERETQDLFRGVFPISLVDAINAGEDFELWQQSGADAFAVALVELADHLAGSLATMNREFSTEPRQLAPDPTAKPGAGLEPLQEHTPEAVCLRPENPSPEGKVTPRRVNRLPNAGAATQRLRPEEAAAPKFV
ncbi:MAG: dynamin family protein [Rhodobacter sp.]|nr:dynamin family protein [Rhodobacter sp.]